jgi:3-phenylpropionate/cinnamic acid dioxygenase small subunit
MFPQESQSVSNTALHYRLHTRSQETVTRYATSSYRNAITQEQWLLEVKKISLNFKTHGKSSPGFASYTYSDFPD